MSLPPELRLLCNQLSDIDVASLPRRTPLLVRNAARCGTVLCTDKSSISKSDSSEVTVLVHRLHTQLSTLLYGKTAEGRFAAVVLIKTVTDVGGYEVLKGVESWVRGLLALLGKSDPVSSKRLCIMTLTGIYMQTHQYQSLLREITTPTLPIFVAACLNLVDPRAHAKSGPVSFKLLEATLEGFSVLIVRHPTIFRPSVKQIRSILRPLLAPTYCQKFMIPTRLERSAQQLWVLLYQVASKNASGEEWAVALRRLVDGIHKTSDQVFRAIVEDWVSAVGRDSQYVDLDKRPEGGGESEEDLPPWIGIDAGLQRLIAQLGLLQEHFSYPTSTAVTIQLAALLDVLARLLTPRQPAKSKTKAQLSVRVNPAIERAERESLWVALPEVHEATLKVYETLMSRLRESFMPIAETCLAQILWVFPSQNSDTQLKITCYNLLTKLLPQCGLTLPKGTVDRVGIVVQQCCQDLVHSSEQSSLSAISADGMNKTQPHDQPTNNHNILPTSKSSAKPNNAASPELRSAAWDLLPVFLNNLPHQHLEGYRRAQIERTSILIHHRETMLASVLNPVVGKAWRAFPSILPHLCRDSRATPVVETLLRPRMPVLRLNYDITVQPNLDQFEDEKMEDAPSDTQSLVDDISPPVDDEIGTVEPPKARYTDYWGSLSQAATIESIVNDDQDQPLPEVEVTQELPSALPQTSGEIELSHPHVVESSHNEADEEEEDDSDESVHLVLDESDSDENDN